MNNNKKCGSTEQLIFWVHPMLLTTPELKPPPLAICIQSLLDTSTIGMVGGYGKK